MGESGGKQEWTAERRGYLQGDSPKSVQSMTGINKLPRGQPRSVCWGVGHTIASSTFRRGFFLWIFWGAVVSLQELSVVKPHLLMPAFLVFFKDIF